MVGVYCTLNLNIRPSDFVGIDEDEYTRFCFDEAFAFILSKLKAGETPTIHTEAPTKSYSRPSDFYKKFERRTTECR